jgi:hypothetical protein
MRKVAFGFHVRLPWKIATRKWLGVLNPHKFNDVFEKPSAFVGYVIIC